VFVEDTMVSIGKTAVMARPGHSSRQGEVASMRDVALQLGMNVIDMDDPEATLDGGDCLFTGRHLYVGISQRTNEKGFRELEKVYKDFTRVLPVPLPLSCASLHLKSVVTHLDEETLLAPIGKEEVLGNMLDSGGYETLLVPHPSASNVVVVNGHVLAQDVNCEESRDIIARACQERSFRLHWMDTSEFAKIDGALTCCSILLDI
jgi:dimethylargininase